MSKDGKSQDSIAKHLRWVTLLHIYHSICWWKKIKIGEHLAKLQAKWLIVLYAPFALHFCPQRYWSLQISWITCVLRTETVTNRCSVNKQINVSLLSTNNKLLWTSFHLLTDRLAPSVTDRLLIMYGILQWQLFFVVAVVYSGLWDFYMADVNNFMLLN